MMVRIIAGNWKMHKTRREAAALTEAILAGVGSLDSSTELRLYPPFTCLATVAEEASRGKLGPGRLSVGAQNLHPEPEGAYTGEVSARMILESGASTVLVGHSERRVLFGESDELLSRKVRSAVESGLRALFCLGEDEKARETGRTEEVVAHQVRAGLGGIDAGMCDRIEVAYEPIWAIGTGKVATVEQVAAAHRFLRGRLIELWGEAGGTVPLLYGGSVKPGNAGEILGLADVDGVLVGGASLQASDFLAIAAS